MAKRVPWDQYEAALLIDAYYRIDEKKIDRKIAVELISSELRKKAEKENKEIDKIFRNTNGINMRFYEIQFIVTGGKVGMKNTSRLFVDTVGMYKSDKQHFGEVYSQALSKVYAGTDFEHFMLWIDKSTYSAHRKRIEYASRMIYSFGEERALGINTKYDLGIAAGIDAYSEFLNSTNLKKENKKVTNATNDVELRAKDFSKWMIDTRKLSVATARGYSSAINTATPYAQSICKIDKSIYAIDDVGELENLLKTLMHDKGFADLNAQSHNRFRGAFDKYLQYMLSCNGELTNTGFVEQQDSGSYEEIEEMVRSADVKGISSSELSNKTGKSIWLINKYLRKQEYAVEVPGEIYIHVDNVIDIFENKEKLRKIIENQFSAFSGYTNDVVLMESATISLGMFLNDNCIDSPGKIYGIARYLFSRVEDSYCFAADKHIWKEQPKYSMTNPGVLMEYMWKSGGRLSKNQCTEYLQKVKLPTRNINGLLSVANSKEVLLYGNEEYVLAECIIEDGEWLNRVNDQIAKLFRDAAYVVLREISSNWFDLLPALNGGLAWNLSLLQDLVKKYLPKYRLITANENQSLETIRAGIVPEDSIIGNFGDLVYARLLEDHEISLPVRIEKEDFRQRLINYQMIQGNELIYTMPKSVTGAKYAWSGDGESVLIL